MPTPNDELAEELAQLQGALKPAEVAEYLEVHPATVYRLIASGQLRTIRIGSGRKRRTGLKVPQSAVVEYLRSSQPFQPGDGATGALRIPESVLNSTDLVDTTTEEAAA